MAQSWGRANLGPGDAVLLTQLEHHANIVPWFQLQAEKGFEIRWIPLTADGQLDLTDLDTLLDGAKLFAFTAMSNVLGTLTPVERARPPRPTPPAPWSASTPASTSPTSPPTWPSMGADFVAFTGHKMLGPTGIGVLWGREELLDAMPTVPRRRRHDPRRHLDGFIPADAARQVRGRHPAHRRDRRPRRRGRLPRRPRHGRRPRARGVLTAYALRTLTERFGDQLTIHGPTEPAMRGGVLSASAIEGIHPHDLSQVLDEHAVCVRAGHHCAKPLMRVLGVAATARASFYVYNDTDDVDALADALAAAQSFFVVLISTTGRPPMPGLEDLYREIILDHYRNPRNRGELEAPPATRTEGFNPLCGDEIVVYLDLDDAGVVDDIRIGGQGCSISQSSASMMSAAVKGKTVERGRRAHPRLQGDDVDPRVVTRRRRRVRRGPPRSSCPKASSSATSRPSAAS